MARERVRRPRRKRGDWDGDFSNLIFFLMVMTIVLMSSFPSATQHDGSADHPHDPPRRPPQAAPCPPCRCLEDVLDCSLADPLTSTMSSKPLSIGGWNITGFRKVVIDGGTGPQGSALMGSTLLALPPAPGVRVLSVRYQGLTNIATASFMGLEDLRELDLSHNQLTVDAVRADVLRGPWRADSYEPLGLDKLDLSHNALHALSRRALEHVKNLKTLYLDGNPLRALDRGTQAALASATGLQELGLSGCGLASLPSDLSVVLPRGLLALDVSHNALVSVPRGWPASLARLTLDGNPIRRLPDSDSLVPPFLQAAGLAELSVSAMPVLEEVGPGAFFGLANLRSLRMSHNPALRRLDPDAFGHLGPSWMLTEVNLRNNSLRWLHPGLLAWRRLAFLDVADNPWHCSCNFTQWASGTLGSVSINTKEDVRCSTPAELDGSVVWNVSSTACSSEAATAGRASLFTDALLLAAVASLVAVVAMLVRQRGGGEALRLQGRAGRVPLWRADSLKEPLYEAAATEEEPRPTGPGPAAWAQPGRSAGP